jgi:hypothetical protein
MWMQSTSSAMGTAGCGGSLATVSHLRSAFARRPCFCKISTAVSIPLWQWKQCLGANQYAHHSMQCLGNLGRNG